jgi:hypothetical protein
MWDIATSDEHLRSSSDTLFRPAEERAAPEVAQRPAAVFPKVLAAGFSPVSLTLKASALRVAQDWFERPEVRSCILRFAVSSVIDVNEPGSGMNAMGMATMLPTIGFNRGVAEECLRAAGELLLEVRDLELEAPGLLAARVTQLGGEPLQPTEEPSVLLFQQERRLAQPLDVRPRGQVQQRGVSWRNRVRTWGRSATGRAGTHRSVYCLRGRALAH